MSIKTRDDANNYYDIINNLVDVYLEKWKIRPSNLRRYLKPGSNRFNKFLERNKLKDIKGSDIILKDIIEDRFSMEKDGVLTFESFKFFESDEFKIISLRDILNKGIEKADIKMEKILADHFDTNLSDIDIVDSDKHQFKINDWENYDVDVIIYSNEDLEIVEENIFEYMFNELSKKKIELIENLSINLIDFISKDDFKIKVKKEFTKDKLIMIISTCLDGYKFKKEVDGYFIWFT